MIKSNSNLKKKELGRVVKCNVVVDVKGRKRKMRHPFSDCYDRSIHKVLLVPVHEPFPSNVILLAPIALYVLCGLGVFL